METRPSHAPAVDRSGFRVFSSGNAGLAHARAHRDLERAEHEAGRRALAAWLEDRPATDGKLAHLHWHLMVFELGCGDVAEAHARFSRELLPVASTTEDALTDAPSAVWRLRLAGAELSPREVEAVAHTARAHLEREPSADPWVVLHDLLALAAAGHTGAIDAWLARGEGPPTLRLAARGLRALADGDMISALAPLVRATPDIRRLGGSHAQNALFFALAAHVEARTMRHSIAA